MATIIGLNIGGKVFQTTKATLCPEGTTNFFTALLSDAMPSTKDKDDNYFIDRDGQYFKPLLEFLRTGDLVIPKDMNYKSLLREADFYQIEVDKDILDEAKCFNMDKLLQESQDRSLFKKYSKELELVVKGGVIPDLQEKASQGLESLVSSVVGMYQHMYNVTCVVNFDYVQKLSKRPDLELTWNQSILCQKPKIVDDVQTCDMICGNSFLSVLVRYCRAMNLSVRVEPVQFSYLPGSIVVGYDSFGLDSI